MKSEMLIKAQEYEQLNEKRIDDAIRPSFHLSSRVGWMNDPNGFSLYEGKYHMFYQYYPYESKWGPMYWAHAVSKDLLHWEYLPVVMAPDMPYDDFGCFSGTAITTKDGKHLLMYTCVKNHYLENGQKTEYQQQAIAIGDGLEYTKSEHNPVISTEQIPEGYSPLDFRDPKIWLGSDGIYRVLIGAMDDMHRGTILLYTSNDCINWEYKKVFAKNDGRYGRMWECPDFFVLDGKGVVIVSPQDMLPDGYEHIGGNGSLCLIGTYDEATDEFTIENTQSVDYGIDFYAPETIATADNRRVMMGWMQNWDTIIDKNHTDLYFGQMTLPRELNVINDRLYQKPITELLSYRTNEVVYHDVEVHNEEISLDGINGRTLEMDVKIRPGDVLFDRFVITLARNASYHTTFTFTPSESLVEIDRTYAGSRRLVAHQRKAIVDDNAGCLKAKLVLDKYSIEIFINDGIKTITTTIPTPLDANQISFKAVGLVKLDVSCWELSL